MAVLLPSLPPLATVHDRNTSAIIQIDEESEQADESSSSATDCINNINNVLMVTRFGWSMLRLALFASNLLTWYWANGMNGIAMQSFASKIRQQQNQPQHQHQQHGLVFYLATTSFVTALQLLLGAVVGSVLLWVLFHTVAPMPQQQQQQRRPFHMASLLSLMYLHHNKKQRSNEWFLSSLHGLGSLTTNLGFMYGTAYLVQIIKLLEPLETLFFSYYFSGSKQQSTTNATTTTSSTSSKVCRVGIVCSIVVVVGSAISLIPWQQTSKSNTHLAAIVFALLSGCALSLRNVFQQKQHASIVLDNDATTTATATAATTIEQQDHHNHEQLQLSKLERSVMQFTKLSFQSGLVMAAFSLLFSMLLASSTTSLYLSRGIMTTASNSTTAVVFQSLTWNVLVWHPMYNVTSMIVLGFCGSAVTHSLFNAGKRVFSILIAMLWMEQQQEQSWKDTANSNSSNSNATNSHATKTYFRLIMVAVGAIWYTLETQQQQQQQQNQNVTGSNFHRHHSSSSSSSSLPTTTATTATTVASTPNILSWLVIRYSGCDIATARAAQSTLMTGFKVVVCVVMVHAVLFPSG